MNWGKTVNNAGKIVGEGKERLVEREGEENERVRKKKG